MSQKLKAEVYTQLSTCHCNAFFALFGFFLVFLNQEIVMRRAYSNIKVGRKKPHIGNTMTKILTNILSGRPRGHKEKGQVTSHANKERRQNQISGLI